MKHITLTSAPNREETIFGCIWLVISLTVLPSIFTLANDLLGAPLNVGLLNVVYYIVNFCVTVYLFRHFLRSSVKEMACRPVAVVWYAVLAYLGYQVLTELLGIAILWLKPDFYNVNDASIFSMMSVPLALATVFLVPLTEETLYRGLIFRKLFDKMPVGAYLISMAIFAAVHVVGYVGSFSPLTLLLCFLQYLPAGYCLCWCYRQTGTILAPMLMHMMVNGVGVYYGMR